MPRGNTAVHGTRHRSSGGTEQSPALVPAMHVACPRPGPPWRVSLRPLGTWGALGGPPGVMGQCALGPLDVAVPCKIQRTHSLTGPGNGVGSLPRRGGGEGAASAASPWYSERPGTWPAFPQPGSGRASMEPSHGVVSEARGAGGGPGCPLSPPQPSGPRFPACGASPATVFLPVSPSAHVPCRPCRRGCLDWDAR